MPVRQSGLLKQQFTAIAAYDLKEGADPALVNFKAVLSSLTGAQKSGFALPDIAEAADAQAEYETEQGKAAMQFLAGNHPSRMTLALVKAAGPDGKPVVLPVVTDRLYDRVMVIGPGPLPEKIIDTLAKSGLTYINCSQETASKDATEFFVASMRERSDKSDYKKPKAHDMTPERAQAFVENFAAALTLAADYSKSGFIDESGKLRENTLISDMLVAIPQGKAEVAAYTAAAKKTPQPKP